MCVNENSAASKRVAGILLQQASKPAKQDALCSRVQLFLTPISVKMPKAVKGALLQCDPPQMVMVRKMDKESDHAYIIEEIDDRTCLVKENMVDEIKRRVKEIMDAAMGLYLDEDDDKDSDLD
jgi:TFIIH basal transcription factor complex TTD-A subunit